MAETLAIIRVIDLETTGFEPPEAEVCEIGWSDIAPSGLDLAGEPAGWVDSGRFTSRFIKPTRPIPPETSAIHHIIDRDVEGEIDWRSMTSTLRGDLTLLPAIYAAHNAGFEQKFLTETTIGPVQWICTYKAALRLWSEAPGHSNQTLRYWRGLALGETRAMANQAHRAGPDAYVTALILCDMLNQPGVTLAQLIAWTNEPALLVKCHIGSWRGRRWAEIDDPSFFRWILNRDFSEDVLFTARHHYDRLMTAIDQEASDG